MHGKKMLTDYTDLLVLCARTLPCLSKLPMSTNSKVENLHESDDALAW